MSQPVPTNPVVADAAKPLLLLVDDKPTNLHILVAALKAEYRLKTVTSGQAALDLLERDDQPELILLDVMMPGISGIDVLRHIRLDERTRDIPVIIISADTSDQTQIDGLDFGADDYLPKPVVANVLRARIRNLLARKNTERQLRLAAHVFRYSGEAILISDRQNRIIDVNPAFTELTGYSLDEIIGRNPSLLASGRTSPEQYRELWESLMEKGIWRGEMWDRHKNGHIYPKLITITSVKNHHGDIDYFIASFSDITSQKAAEERIRHIAHHDALTGLPNRLYLSIALGQALATSQRKNAEVALLFLDMDRFKNINDTLGHHVGDQLLVEVAIRIKSCVRESDIVARLGGDEFVVALTDIADHAAIRAVASKILDSLSQPYQLSPHVLHSTPSIGISVFPENGHDIGTLMKNADTAMYHAKEQGRNNIQFFRPEMNAGAGARLEIERDLRTALDGQQFELHYQPQICGRTGCLLGAEALIRWRHPERGLVPPGDFIPVAEDSGLIKQIGDWVLDESGRRLQAWQQAGLDKLTMAVNLSAQQLRDPELLGKVRALMERHGIVPGRLELEVTESVAMDNPARAIDLLHKLRALGVTLAIDDFGTGYSSLAYLKNLPIQTLKIDRSFVHDIETDANDAAISSATIALAHSLGLKVVAEGVETLAQQRFLTAQGCDILQGYLFGKPVPADEFAQTLQHYPLPPAP